MSEGQRRPPPPRRPVLLHEDDASDTVRSPDTQRSSYQPTLRDVSAQVGALSSHLMAVHDQVNLTRSEVAALAKRIEPLEGEAKWGRRIVVALKAAVPFVGGILVTKFPALAGLVSDLVKALGDL